jgi:glycosyltransferase involved in cell wall biosynthesis
MCLRDTSKGFEHAGMAPFPVWYAPHAVDAVYSPRDRRFREQIDVPADAYLVGIVAANNGTKIYDRKGFGDMAAALARFMDTHADAYVYVHTIKDTFDGMNLDILFEFKGVPKDRLRWADQYAIKKQAVSDDDMAAMYSALDVLLATSRGEGFGIPVIEAQACGIPVIASNWTAQSELVGNVFNPADLGTQRLPSGWLVSVDPDWDPRHGADFAKPRIGMVIACLNEAYDRRGDETLRDAALAKAAGYAADTVFEAHWRPILADMERELAGPSRAERRLAKRTAAVATRQRRRLRAVV